MTLTVQDIWVQFVKGVLYEREGLFEEEKCDIHIFSVSLKVFYHQGSPCREGHISCRVTMYIDGYIAFRVIV